MTKRTFLRIALGLAVLAAAVAALAPWLAGRYLPPERLRALVSEQARKSVGREVRIGGVAYGVWGARLSDVSVSEKPDFSAGTFVTVGRLSVRPAWGALLRRRLVIKSVAAEDGRLRYADPKSRLTVDVSELAVTVKGFRLSGPFDAAVSLTASGRRAGKPFQARLGAEGTVDLGGSDPKAFHAELSRLDVDSSGLSVKGSARVSGLSPAEAYVDLKVAAPGGASALGLPAGVSAPPLRITGGAAYGGDAVTLQSLVLDAGAAATVELSGGVTGLGAKPELALKAQCPSFDLGRLAAIDADAKDLALSGGGSFEVSAEGPASQPRLSGRADFHDVGATVAGLPLSGFGGSVSFSGDSAEVSGLHGRLADGELRLSLKAKNYRTHPDVELQASVDRFDLGRFLDAKESWSKKRNSLQRSAPTEASVKAPSAAGPQSGPAPSGSSPSGSANAPFSVDTRGQLTVGDLLHPNIEARNVSVQWSLSGVSSDLSKLNGSAKVSSNGGQIHTLSDASKKSKVAKVLLIPLMVIDKLGRLAGLRLFPDFSNAAYSELAGDYAFQNGLMTINDSHINANVGKAKAEGHIDLAREQLAMRILTQAEQMAAPLEIEVGGTFDQPKAKIKAEKLLEQGAKQLLEGPAKQLLQQLFGH